ncbi:ParB/RepB/Spo0J family partition protein [Micromonospora sp. DT81.3]|uniref:ParB/RepB/Spo0J family partition protein n=1 Tax=Micromonospora sp. DT81.3 TaxID=3416523 RepID=UPI003CEF1947
MDHTTAPTGTIEHIHPQNLIIEANVRPSAPLTREFVQSIRENGVLTPVLARRDTNGNVLVRAGQRRILAAREATLPSIPVYIVDADDATSERIIQQMIENDQREALTTGERVAAFKQLTLEGLSVAAIAKRTGTKQKEVQTAVAVADNAVAATAAQEHALTLQQAAVLIEFEGDADLIADLVQTATGDPGAFDHAVQRARDDKARTEAKAAVEAAYAERGYEILDSGYDNGCVEHYGLRDAEGNRVTSEHIEQIEGRAVYVQAYHSGEPYVRYFIRDPKAAGLTTDNGSGSTAAPGPMTDEQKAERRELIANNKAWDSAETVRRQWLTTLLGRKTLPKDGTAFVAKGLTIHRIPVSRGISDGNALAHELLGIQRGDGYYPADRLHTVIEHTPAKAAHVALAVVLGGIEASTSRSTWRNPTAHDAAYFHQLAAWGYGLSDVEQIVLARGEATAATDDDQQQ